jgi:hypothetical protein
LIIALSSPTVKDYIWKVSGNPAVMDMGLCCCVARYMYNWQTLKLLRNRL